MWAFFTVLKGKMISKCSENHWGHAHEIMASNGTILLPWQILKMKWRIYEFLTKNPKMPKNQKLSKWAQNWGAWPSRVLGNMFRSWSQNFKCWYAFLLFPCQALPFSILFHHCYGFVNHFYAALLFLASIMFLLKHCLINVNLSQTVQQVCFGIRPLLLCKYCSFLLYVPQQ